MRNVTHNSITIILVISILFFFSQKDPLNNEVNFKKKIIEFIKAEDSRDIKKILMSLTIKSNKNVNMDKNEIDILINTGQKMLFIECKSGIVSQSDINKMRVISKFYGGLGSKSILVSYYKPKDYLIEKCQDFGIEVFYLEENNKKNIELKSISKKLDLMLSKIEV